MPRPNDVSRPDLYSRITRQILDQLEVGVRPWSQPWAGGTPASRPLRHDGTPYRGINVLLLWAEAAARGYRASTWMTFRQALALGGCVRKGEHGATVVYAHVPPPETSMSDADELAPARAFLKAYTVFNIEQIEGLGSAFSTPAEVLLNPGERIAAVEAFVRATGAQVGHGGGMAYYAPGPDRVQMPPFESFRDPEAYYATLAHELTHWTAHASRLDRSFGARRHGDVGYACEELVAELGAAFLCADLGLSLEPREDHAAYIAHWIQVLKDDRRFIFSAAAHAQKAVDLLHALQP